MDKEINPNLGREAKIRIDNVRAKMLLHQPFYGVLLSMLDFVIEPTIKTMATDSKKIYFSPSFVMGLSEKEVFAVLLHEISHCIYLHLTPKRRLNREHHRWNIACDHAINLEIQGMGYSLPMSWKDENGKECKPCCDARYSDKCAEEIYDSLDEKDAKSQQTMDGHIENIDSNDWDDMEDRVLSAYEMTKNSSMGNVPAGIKRAIDLIKKSRVRWERIFHKYVGQALAKDDYSFARTNKRYLGQDIYLPDLRSYIIGGVVVAIDTSGSIGKDDISQFAAELSKINHLVNEITCITCDAEIQEVIKISKFQSFLDKLHFKGGGGTSHRPVFDYIKSKLNNQIELFIGLTDMYSDINSIKKPPYPVIWVSTSEVKTADFGVVIQMPQR